MFGIVIAAILGVCAYEFESKSFYECYLSSTMFLLWWTIGAGVTAFLLRRISAGMPKKFCNTFHLSKLARITFFRREPLFCFFAVFSIGAAYLLHSSLDGLEGLRYWDSLRLVSGISMYCVIVFMNYFDFRKAES